MHFPNSQFTDHDIPRTAPALFVERERDDVQTGADAGDYDAGIGDAGNGRGNTNRWGLERTLGMSGA